MLELELECTKLIFIEHFKNKRCGKIKVGWLIVLAWLDSVAQLMVDMCLTINFVALPSVLFENVCTTPVSLKCHKTINVHLSRHV